MADPPRLTKLGAKWVEVRKRRAQGFPKWHDEGVLKTWPATPVKHRSLKPEGVALDLSELLLLTKGSSRGRSAIQKLADWQVPIADYSAAVAAVVGIE